MYKREKSWSYINKLLNNQTINVFIFGRTGLNFYFFFGEN